MPDTDLTAALDEIRERYRHGDPDGFGAVLARTHGAPQDVPRLLAAVDAVLARHVPKTITVRHLCGSAHSLTGPQGRAFFDAVDTCPDCVKEDQTVCAACDPVCPDDNQWPCADVAAITRALLGEDGTDG